MSNRLHQYTVLIVDDAPENIMILSHLLMPDYTVRAAVSGEKALEIIFSDDPPDLILLDIVMPKINGYEVCKRLKAAGETVSEIPVIFLSGMTETDDKVKAFEAGGVDYITKPFALKEVQARIETHLKISSQKRELEKQKQQIEDSYTKLRELELLKDNLTHMIVHDMRTPLMGISGNLELLSFQEESNISARAAKHINHARESTRELIEMISALLDVSRMEAGEMILNISRCDLIDIMRRIVDTFEGLLGKRYISYDIPVESVEVNCDPHVISRVIQNLLYNAIKVTPEANFIRIGVSATDDVVRVSVTDNGPGIPAEYHEKIFDKFCQIECRDHKQKYSTGLGLTFCKMAVEAHRGHIGIESEVGKGSMFWFELPSS
mgnify:FL=1